MCVIAVIFSDLHISNERLVYMLSYVPKIVLNFHFTKSGVGNYISNFWKKLAQRRAVVAAWAVIYQ